MARTHVSQGAIFLPNFALFGALCVIEAKSILAQDIEKGMEMRY
jgi:hypothetical protein